MLEIVARLPGRSVFLAGETVECHVTFTNRATNKTGSSKNGSTETTPAPGGSGLATGKLKSAKLAWSSAQIHCQCSVSDSRVNITDSGLSVSGSRQSLADLKYVPSQTSFVPFQGEKGATVLSTKPTILFCDLTLPPGESQTYVYKEVLPSDAPPSYRGSALKYSYKITIGAQRFGCQTKLVRLPFRVLVVPGLLDTTVYQEPETEVSPTNPFRQQQTNDNSLLDVALENLQTIACRKGPSFYNITNSRGRVARFCLFKPAYRIGDDVVGTCDFTVGTVNCVQFSVTLQSEEQISEVCRRKPSSTDGTTLTSYSRHEEFCVSTAKTNISLSIPLTATPAFFTELVTLRWRLHFEFVTSKVVLPSPSSPSSPSDPVVWQAPAHLDVETMVWDLPIKVFATNPVFVSSVSLLRSQVGCVL